MENGNSFITMMLMLQIVVECLFSYRSKNQIDETIDFTGVSEDFFFFRSFTLMKETEFWFQILMPDFIVAVAKTRRK